MSELKKEMYTTSEAATIFGVSRQTILTWIREGVLIAARPKREFRIMRSEIERVMEGE